MTTAVAADHAHSSRPWPYLRLLITSFCTTICVLSALTCFAIWAPRDQQAIERHIIEAANSGEFASTVTFGPFIEATFFKHEFSCLPLSMMLAPQSDRLTDALSNRRPMPKEPIKVDVHAPPDYDCQAVLAALPGAAKPVSFHQYDRYILAMRPLGRVLLSFVSLATMSTLIFATAYGLLASIAVTALIKLKLETIGREQCFGYLTVAFCLAFLCGAHVADRDLTFGPMDCVQYTFTLIALFRPLGRMSPSMLAIYGAAYGTLITSFEFLTGGIPLALSLIPILLALGFEGDSRTYFGKLARIWSAFCVAIIVTLAAKQALCFALWPSSDDFLGALLPRMWGYAPITADTPPVATKGLLQTYRLWTWWLAFGSRNAGTVILWLGIAALVVQTYRFRSQRPIMVLGCWLSLVALSAWATVFYNHAVLHAFFMARLLVVPVMAGFVLAAVTWGGSLALRPQAPQTQ